MNSTISDDLNREHLAFEAAKCLKNIFANTQNVTALHKELLEINLSITAYIEESKNRLEGLRLDLVRQATSSHKVNKMSNFPKTPKKRRISYKNINSSKQETNNNTKTQFSKQESARNFIIWYKRMVDNDRQNFGMFLSDDVTLEWFGRTVKTRKKVAAFIKHDIQCSRHDFTTVQSIERIQSRNEILQRKDDTVLASPLHSPEIDIPKIQRSGKRKIQTTCNSPQWAEGCEPSDEGDTIECKRKRLNDNVGDMEISNNGDGMMGKRKSSSKTPPNMECGQGDCLPSTSGAGSETSHDTLNTQIPKLAVECNGYVEFNRSRNSRSSESMKWDRKCKLQISYSEDPLNVGEYIIWALRYSDESKCRRNLLAAFEEAASDE
ncbi:unnamed protein product [Euphydryas editha]|uniref:Uncharacterized protein n=1 Tax=Euphydryas editha TaxID=104508 RepID=A0AAU9TQT8_EUPED|nr:unnamed protein product [Euphydryas editha]